MGVTAVAGMPGYAVAQPRTAAAPRAPSAPRGGTGLGSAYLDGAGGPGGTAMRYDRLRKPAAWPGWSGSYGGAGRRAVVTVAGQRRICTGFPRSEAG
ncbi:hypothetical protein GCM10010324_16550 [Streptomyces hiroshimensis]|uniref:Uncharacterized protein n=1 Tax=Streptomyces hiroshimensis TaxID=66424 RepID=A0ABQ2Y9V3_9ACTN|nr:hypothetical protein GCM10010324_16550 [Streptomyces hiroshimensis]